MKKLKIKNSKPEAKGPKPIEPTLRIMDVNDEQVFSAKKSPSVISGMRRVNITSGKVFKSKINRTSGTISVTRIS
jgi:hypothetical protein